MKIFGSGMLRSANNINVLQDSMIRSKIVKGTYPPLVSYNIAGVKKQFRTSQVTEYILNGLYQCRASRTPPMSAKKYWKRSKRLIENILRGTLGFFQAPSLISAQRWLRQKYLEINFRRAQKFFGGFRVDFQLCGYPTSPRVAFGRYLHLRWRRASGVGVVVAMTMRSIRRTETNTV